MQSASASSSLAPVSLPLAPDVVKRPALLEPSLHPPTLLIVLNSVKLLSEIIPVH